VIVKNAAGAPIDSVVVTFAAVTGAGTLNPTSTRTNASGEATATWTLGPALGAQSATATAGTLAPVTFTATARAGAAATIAKTAGDVQTAIVGANVAVAPSVKVTDAAGNAVASAPVVFSVGSGGGSVNGGTVNTGADGIAAVASWAMGTAIGANTLVATSGTLTATFTATATVGPAANLTLTPTGPLELNTGGTVTVAPRVADAFGNVLASPPVTYSSSNTNVASVSATGVIVATGPGTATVTATSGAAVGTFALTVIGHPVGTAINRTIDLTSTTGDVAFTKTSTLLAANSLMKVVILDADAANPNGAVVTLTTPVPILLAGTKTTGPVLAVNVGTTSRIWFLDPATSAVTDSLDIQETPRAAVITADGTKAYFLLGDGELQPVNVTAHALMPRIQLGGGTTRLRLAPGDTTAYVVTNIGIVFSIDTRTNVARQLVLSVPGNDFVISNDGKSFLALDGIASLVRIIDIASGQVVRTLGVAATASSISISPDGQQIWLTHNNGVTTYTGSVTSGFIAGPLIPMASVPIRIYFSPTGSFAAITNFGGWVDIVR
ncbi:MAG TPA: Ig-like domain-containing protein, partial [Gemmatimonadaceae bacterium]|nr:Ig-like domain-containing protein [Gemmatimonadaceae bacterium]